jgi:hypothetical protein
MLLRCERLEPPMSQMGHFRQVDPLLTLSLCLLCSDRYQIGHAANPVPRT